MSQENKGASPPEQSGDVKGNITQATAVQNLLASYLPQEEAKQEPAKNEATDVAPPVEGEKEAAPNSETTEPPAESVEVTEVPAEEAKTDEGEDVLSSDTDLSPEEREKFKAVTDKWQQGVNKRIGKEKQKRLDAERKAQELEAKINEVAQIKPEPVIVTPPTPDNPLANINTMEELVMQQKHANDAIYQAQAILDRLEESGESEVQIGEQKYTKSTLREIRREAERTLREHIPARHQHLVKKQQAIELLKKDFPEALQKGSQLAQQIQQAKAMYGVLNYVPDADYVIALALEGAKALAAKNQQAKKPVVPPSQKPPASQMAVSAAASPQRNKPNGMANWEAEKRKVVSQGNVSVQQMAEILRKRELSTSR